VINNSSKKNINEYTIVILKVIEKRKSFLNFLSIKPLPPKEIFINHTEQRYLFEEELYLPLDSSQNFFVYAVPSPSLLVPE
jgi:hypothetical protein